MTLWETAASKWKAVTTLSVLLLFVAGVPAYAASADNASGFVADLANRAIQIMREGDRSAVDRQQRFGGLMNEDFDLPKIARTVLGRYWRGTSDNDREAFTIAFAEYMSRMYSERFADYSADTFRVTEQRADGAGTTLVSSVITRAATGQPVNVDWSVTQTADGYKVTDIGAGGVSLSQALREEFSSVIRQGGGVAFLTLQLRTKVHELASSVP